MKKKLLGIAIGLLAALPIFVNAEETTAVAKIGEKTYDTLIEAVEAVKTDETITVLKDTESVGIVVESGKKFTLDFDGHTVIFTSEVGSSGTETLNMQLLENSTLVFKNGTIKPSEKCKMLVQNYANLTLENMTLDGINDLMTYTLSNNSGDVNIIGKTNIYAPDGKVAFDVCGFSNYEIGPKVVVNTTGTIEGTIEVTKASTAANTRPLSLVIENINHIGEMSIQEGLEANVTIKGGSYITNETAEKVTVAEGSEVYQVITTEGEIKYVVAEESELEEGYFGLGFSEEGFEEVFGSQEDYEEIMGLIEEKLAQKYTTAIYYEIVYGGLLNGNLVNDESLAKTKLEEAIEVTLDIPETLEKVKEGYTRKYVVIRVHENEDGEYETTVLDAKEKEDGKVTFETDRFSTYVLAYEDTKAATNPVTPVNPDTFDGISLYMIIASVSLIGLVSLLTYSKKAKNY